MMIAKTIYAQLGGGAFKVMTGARDFVAGESSLSFSLPGGGGFTKGGVNRVSIELQPNDLYKVSYFRKRGNVIKLLQEYKDLYFDQLIPNFEEVTGLVTRMPKVRFA